MSPNGTEVGEVDDRPNGRGFDRRRSLTSGLVRAVLVIVLGVLGENLRQMLLVENQHLIEDLTAERADHALADRIRAGTARRDHGFDARAGKPFQASNQVNVLVAGLHRRCPLPVRGFTCPARRAHRRMTDRTGREGRYQLDRTYVILSWSLRAGLRRCCWTSGFCVYAGARVSGMGLPISPKTRRWTSVGSLILSNCCSAKLTCCLVSVSRCLRRSW